MPNTAISRNAGGKELANVARRTEGRLVLEAPIRWPIHYPIRIALLAGEGETNP
jgi:hypothetical protein